MYAFYITLRWLLSSFRTSLLTGSVLLATGIGAQAQSLRKLEQGAINRTHLTFVDGDTVQRFTVTYDKPEPRSGRFYYWQGPTQILRTAGAYNGRLLTGDYQLTSRNGNLLVSGSFNKGLKTGSWRTWRPDGTPLSSSTWRKGRQWGKTKQYDELGRRVHPVAAPKPAAPIAATSASPRFWQPAYWQGIVKRRKLRRAEKKQVKPAVPAPVKKIKAKKEDESTAPTAVKKVKLRKSKSPVATPVTAPPPQRSGS